LAEKEQKIKHLEKEKEILQKKLDSQPKIGDKKLKNKEPEPIISDISEYLKKIERFYQFERNSKTKL